MNSPDPNFATGRAVYLACAALSATLAESREATLAHLNRGLRRLVLTFGALMVVAGAAVVLVSWSFS